VNAFQDGWQIACLATQGMPYRQIAPVDIETIAAIQQAYGAPASQAGDQLPHNRTACMRRYY
jgi:hypothetical protein